MSRATVLTLLLLAAAWCPARAGVLYGLTSWSPASLYTVDSGTGAATLVATSPNANGSFVGASFLGDTLYGTDLLIDGHGFFETGSLDLGSAAATSVSDQGGSANWHGLGSNESTGELYASDYNLQSIVSLVPGGAPVTIGPWSVFPRGLAYDDANGILYGAGEDNNLYTISTTDATMTLVGSMGVDETNYLGLAYDEDNGVLYLTAMDDAQTESLLYTLDKSTGAATLVGGTGVAYLDGLAWKSTGSPVVPEPASLALLGGGLLAFVRRRRRSA